MEKCCRNCKFYFEGRCNSNNFSVEVYNDMSYVEGGELSLYIKERDLLSKIVSSVFESLSKEENSPIKKIYIESNNRKTGFNLQKFIEKSSEKGHYKIFDELHTLIQMYNQSNKIDSEKYIKINNPSDFSCCKWE